MKSQAIVVTEQVDPNLKQLTDIFIFVLDTKLETNDVKRVGKTQQGHFKFPEEPTCQSSKLCLILTISVFQT
ncbi:hypothetical protein M8C21_001150 [Ambrosia artemisiifolia]|uniref:Uncharacterized protein n=1 Tax=Ambrosia artemisiifolia TaxID=4212 RepID=A0AAD5C0T8_AMBAR|nr:hypothetical protein M8C21_001150 [Ambrosia artemisiifolia]